jgi:O-acetylhomoserine (thiol)-lyase
LHAGAAPDPGNRRARHTDLPVRRHSPSKDSDHAAALFNMERAGHVYSRISNPTTAVLEERIAALEGGVAGIATASGQAALHLGLGHHRRRRFARRGVARALRRIAQPACLSRMRRFGIETTFVDPRDPRRVASAAIRPTTKLLFGEALGNPGLEVLDIPRIAALAHEHHLPLLVDATFTTPLPAAPDFDHGADLVVAFGHQVPVRPRHRDRRTAGGRRHVRLAAGVREAPAASPNCAMPYDGLPRHGVRGRVDGRAIRAARAGAKALRDFGAAMSPHNAFMRSCRASKRCRSGWNGTSQCTRKVAESSRPRTRRSQAVAYPELAVSHPDHRAGKDIAAPEGLRARCSRSVSRATARRANASSKRSRYFFPSGQRRRRQVAGHPSRHPPRTSEVPREQVGRSSGITEGTIRLIESDWKTPTT